MPELLRVVTLRGIQRGVDWRPTQLAGHLPPSLQPCSLCGGVEPTTTALPCSHIFCDNCLRASKAESEGGAQFCVLDGQPFVAEEHACRKKCSAKDAASIKVACWNSCYGCDFIGSPSLLPDHFEVDCKFHPAVCPQCKVTMLLVDLPDHYRTSCMMPLERTESSHWSTLLNHSTSRTTWDEDVTLRAHDTLVSLESRMNELVEYVRDLDTKSTRMSLSLSEVTEIMRQITLTLSKSRCCSSNAAECATLSANPQVNMPSCVSQSATASAEVILAPTPPTLVENGTLSEAHGSIRAASLPSLINSVPVARHGLRRQTTQFTHYVPGREVADRENRAFLALFRRRKAPSSGSASDFMPLYDLLKRGIELSVPETWTAKVALDGNKDCHVKIVILEENSALDVYAKVEERRKTFNPWKVESVRLVHPSESALLSHSSGSHPLEPTWTHSRAARLRFPASGYAFHGSHRFEAMCRRGFVVGDDTVTFCVTLIRKWSAPTESTEAEVT
ncbi:hypothetical protein HPB51_015735 [Rhipicephalus microplus]|uniref:RING-type domain-containing protein n=1 Tax=Rhipicephalus microplus TaxID=6941 RepID=A0A9J6ETS8_RHIMP|nr:hypothetical protein HPB51_015735 [Rhipicephalus microplus]